MPRFSMATMLSVEKVLVEECQNSQYVKPFRLSFVQNGRSRKWDLIKSHDSVAVLMHHVERKSLLFVRQFRPAVYYNRVHKVEGIAQIPAVGTEIDGDPSLGLTVELCAGIVDKNKPLTQIALEEMHEECGFQVPLENLEKICTFRTGVGTTGTEQTIYYAKVTESMKENMGGGNVSEGEFIETVEVPISQAKDMVFDESIAKPTGCAFAIMWFLREKCKPTLGQVLSNHTFEVGLLASGISILAFACALGLHSLRS